MRNAIRVLERWEIQSRAGFDNNYDAKSASNWLVVFNGISTLVG